MRCAGLDAEAIKELDALRAAIATHNSSLPPSAAGGGSGAVARDSLTLPIVVALLAAHSRARVSAAQQKSKKVILMGLKHELKACSKTVPLLPCFSALPFLEG
jgi:hypothetical protein